MIVEAKPSSGSRATADPLYTWVAVVALGAVIAGFARTYYAKIGFSTPQLNALQHLHGLVMSAWFLFFLVQVRLAATARIRLHRQLGVYGAVIAALVVVVGTVTAITAAARGWGPPDQSPLAFLATPLGDMMVFTILVSAALLLRRRPDHHKRLMVVATLSMLSAANARLPIGLMQLGTGAEFVMTDAILLAFVAFDSFRNRRLHPAYAWGAGFVIASHVVRLAVAQTPQWLAFARWLTH
jgi:hypothetical protein